MREKSESPAYSCSVIRDAHKEKRFFLRTIGRGEKLRRSSEQKEVIVSILGGEELLSSSSSSLFACDDMIL